RTSLSAVPNTPALTSLKTSRSAPLRRALRRARSRAAAPSPPVSAAKPTIAGRAAPPRETTLWRRMSWVRSEEHTSELQSRFDLVCRLLLEKKNEQKRDTQFAHV